jgi:hypothetical protein
LYRVWYFLISPRLKPWDHEMKFRQINRFNGFEILKPLKRFLPTRFFA